MQGMESHIVVGNCGLPEVLRLNRACFNMKFSRESKNQHAIHQSPEENVWLTDWGGGDSRC